MYSNKTGHFWFDTIYPGKYGGRPQHIHIKLTTAKTELVSQIYFEGDPICKSDSWCKGAGSRIIPIEFDPTIGSLLGKLDIMPHYAGGINVPSVCGCDAEEVEIWAKANIL